MAEHLSLENTLNWDLITRRTYEAILDSKTQKSLFIPDAAFLVNSRILMIGCSNPVAKNHWWLGVRAEMRLLLVPSSTTNYTASVEAANQVCGLNRLTLIRFPKLTSPYLLNVTFPRWHTTMNLELWKYTGGDIDTVEESLARIENQLNH